MATFERRSSSTNLSALETGAEEAGNSASSDPKYTLFCSAIEIGHIFPWQPCLEISQSTTISRLLPFKATIRAGHQSQLPIHCRHPPCR